MSKAEFEIAEKTQHHDLKVDAVSTGAVGAAIGAVLGFVVAPGIGAPIGSVIGAVVGGGIGAANTHRH